jgi:hypothetical protein
MVGVVALAIGGGAFAASAIGGGAFAIGVIISSLLVMFSGAVLAGVPCTFAVGAHGLQLSSAGCLCGHFGGGIAGRLGGKIGGSAFGVGSGACSGSTVVVSRIHCMLAGGAFAFSIATIGCDLFGTPCGWAL